MSCHRQGTEVAIVGEKSTAISFEGALFKKPIKSLDCEVLSTITGAIVKCGVVRKGENRYEISYRPRNHQGETPATHQGWWTGHQRKSFWCSSEVNSRKA